MSQFEIITLGHPEGITWGDNQKYRDGNRGWGICNTGTGKRVRCVLGGIGCDVDHMAIMETRVVPPEDDVQ